MKGVTHDAYFACPIIIMIANTSLVGQNVEILPYQGPTDQLNGASALQLGPGWALCLPICPTGWPTASAWPSDHAKLQNRCRVRQSHLNNHKLPTNYIYRMRGINYQ